MDLQTKISLSTQCISPDKANNADHLKRIVQLNEACGFRHEQCQCEDRERLGARIMRHLSLRRKRDRITDCIRAGSSLHKDGTII